ncbi:DUF4199 domain-containing protein [Pseudoxanthomonas helianthi]|uniref:DUF4199 domain-containing protein n=1 Tax=Pseudoxanthomonas helianthi TaxID=1453541 RepID=A0A940X204_9GAMM|nr:DUF4199 domain-containing protein [Pseudoxanthomonas helianthi]MBP3984444.1 DUF4199 domain-containing protein [Pseudoxanthomonas helianthi]
MLKKMLAYGAIAGLIAGGVLSLIVLGPGEHGASGAWGMLIGYLTMLVGLSLVFVAIKRHRDEALGGAIRFWPAFALGLGISFVASVIYALAWEAALAISGLDFAGSYANSIIEQQKAKGVSGEALAKLVADMERFKTSYANPAYRLPMTFTEIFPVGVIVSLVSAAVLRNPRVLPARRD